MPKPDINILCVFWQGSFRGRDYSIDDVKRLRRMVMHHIGPRAVRFVCLTNNIRKDVTYEQIELKYNFPGWWSKLELFRSDLNIKGKCLYIDLDVFVIDELDSIIDFSNELTFMQQMPPTFGTPEGKKKMSGKDKGKVVINKFQSSVFTWIAGQYTLDRVMRDELKTGYLRNKYRGDQDAFGKIFGNHGGHFPSEWFIKIKDCFKKRPPESVKCVLGNPKVMFRQAIENQYHWLHSIKGFAG